MNSKLTCHSVKLTDNVWTNYLRERGYQSIEIKKVLNLKVSTVYLAVIPVGSGLSSFAALECGFIWTK
jgi:galactokinase